MNLKPRSLVSALASALAFGMAANASAAVITKAPDLGAYWAPLSSMGSYVYADSFIASVSGNATDLGWWFTGGGANYVLEILADGGSGPNGAAVLGKTAVQSGTASSLTFVDFAPLANIALVAGTKYWFTASTVGNLGGNGAYQVGGHTQNSGGIVDDGVFDYSNDPNGLVFDGANLTPEMAFSVTIGPAIASAAVPEPASLALLGIGIGGGLVVRRRRAIKA